MLTIASSFHSIMINYSNANHRSKLVKRKGYSGNTTTKVPSINSYHQCFMLLVNKEQQVINFTIVMLSYALYFNKIVIQQYFIFEKKDSFFRILPFISYCRLYLLCKVLFHFVFAFALFFCFLFVLFVCLFCLFVCFLNNYCTSSS